MRSALGRDGVLPFALESYRVIIEHRADGQVVSEATVKVVVDGRADHRHGRGQRPGQRPRRGAARRARRRVHPWLADVELSDYKVRIARGRGGDARHGRRDAGAGGVDRPGRRRGAEWTTVGVHGNVVEASWLALVDAVAYAGLRQGAEDGALSGAAAG